MKLRELRELVKWDRIETIILDEFTEGYSIYVTEPENNNFVSQFGHWLESEIGEVRVYTSIDRAVEMLKGLGYSKKIEVRLVKEEAMKL